MSFLENMEGRVKNTSLTKHGAHKIKRLLEKHGADKVLENLRDPEESININLPQARKNLSAYRGKVPDFWDRAVKAGDEVLRGMVLMAIILSHADLVKGMKRSGAGGYKGTVIREGGNEDKVFTNLRNNISSLGFATSVAYRYVSYDFSNLFSNDDFRILLKELVYLKIGNARGWAEFDYLEAVQEERVGEIFGSDGETFLKWLFPEEEFVKVDFEYAEQIGAVTAHDDSHEEFQFVPGHNERASESYLVKREKLESEVSVAHNLIQNKLYEDLVKEFGGEYVGTEQKTSSNTYIDIMVKTEDYCCLYEIKTASTAKICIRQALSQLLEYAYWGGGVSEVDKLVIVAEAAPTEESDSYLDRLREQNGIPVYYQQFSPF